MACLAEVRSVGHVPAGLANAPSGRTSLRVGRSYPVRDVHGAASASVLMPSPLERSYIQPWLWYTAQLETTPASIWEAREQISALRATERRAEALAVAEAGGRVVTGKERCGVNAAEDEIRRLREALRLAGIRLGICADRMRGCHEETGQHELLDEVEMFEAEARQALAQAPSMIVAREAGRAER